MAKEDGIERSESGSPVYRHAERTKPTEIVHGDTETIDAIGDHIETYVGPIANVFHELVSDLIHLDVMIVEPSEGRNFYTLVTCGMSDLPMRVPIDDPEDLGRVPKLRYAELLVNLPADWPMGPEEFKQEDNYWPIYWLKRLARLPHEYETWLGEGHTIPNGDPAEPFAANTAFTGWIVNRPLLFDEKFNVLECKSRFINFYTINPLYPEEMALKLRKGMSALNVLLDTNSISEVLDLHRKNVARVT
jgi:Suppressor of fused protein (SUFU)